MIEASAGGHFDAFVFGSNRGVEQRTVRSLENAGGAVRGSGMDWEQLGDALQGARGNIALAQSGVWFPLRRRIPDFPASGEWIAAGAWKGSHGDAAVWERALVRSGGHFSKLPWWAKRLPPPPAVLLSCDAAHRFGALVRDLKSVEKAWRGMQRGGGRMVHLPEFDSYFSSGLRVMQVVTSIQIGGAERVALDLAAGLPAHGIASLVVTLGKPLRDTFPAPSGLVDLSEFRSDPALLAEAVRNVALEFGADAIHAHLIRAAEARAIRRHGLPLILHIHNSPAGWPPDYLRLEPGDATVLAGCAQMVESEIRRLLPEMTARTIWNGIAPAEIPNASPHDAFTVVTLANPRGQKRLERIPEIALATAKLFAPRRVQFVIAGSREPYSTDSAEAIAALDAAIITHNAGALIERPGLLGNPATLLADADAMLSVSAYEGLSLAHLEALSAGVPLVATDAGGTREIAAQSEAVTILPVDASAGEFAAALSRCRRGTATLPPGFTRHKMAARAAWLTGATVRRAARRKGEGLWLIANNFSTGGAQSSARRLLVALHERGIRVRAAVIQEQPGFPTIGRRALTEAGIPVLAVPPAGERPVDVALAPLLDAIERDPPQAVFFWNLIASWKVLLADALLDMRVFDVSPGEMLFSSLARFFENPPAGLPYRSAADYGVRLSGIIVKYHAESARAAALGCPVTVIRNGVPLRPISHRGKNDRLVLGTAARLSPDKKLDDLIAAVRLAAPGLPPFVLRIAGGAERDFPQYAAELKKLAHGLPVEWVGELPDTRAFMGALDIFLMISEPAGCPNATLEAAASGLPVIATDHGGACEQVIDGMTGRLVPRGDARAFAAALVDLGRTVELRVEMGRAAREHVGREFSMTRMADQYLELICGSR